MLDSVPHMTLKLRCTLKSQFLCESELKILSLCMQYLYGCHNFYFKTCHYITPR